MAAISLEFVAALVFLAALLATDLPYFFYRRSGGKRFARTVVFLNTLFVVFGVVVLVGVLRNAV
ncbi:MAG: hypothetical protein Q8K62_00875 [Thiobacillus sp.]|nr:hypothetical protein [Thiobacillus sp.]